jgi:hypothetical protein
MFKKKIFWFPFINLLPGKGCFLFKKTYRKIQKLLFSTDYHLFVKKFTTLTSFTVASCRFFDTSNLAAIGVELVGEDVLVEVNIVRVDRTVESDGDHLRHLRHLQAPRDPAQNRLNWIGTD